MQVQAFFHAETGTVSYLVSDPSSAAAAIIDPVLDFEPASGRVSTESADRLLARLDAQQLRLDWVLETHIHADHLSAARYLQSRRGGRIGIGAKVGLVLEHWRPLFGREDIEAGAFDREFEDGECFACGRLEVAVMHTPGHTPLCVSYRIGAAVFVGDTVFMPDLGTARTDFPGGDAATLYRSIGRLLALPDATTIYVGHDYPPPERGPVWAASVAEQKAHNRMVGAGITEAEYVALRQERDRQLAPPRLLLPALQVNLRAGGFGRADANGRKNLTIPLSGDWLG